MPKKECLPPALAEWILKAVYSDQGRYSHLGDFYEAFEDICRTRGRSAARTWYRLQVLKSLPGFLSNKIYWSAAMLRNYLVISFRNIVKNKWFSLINLAGLAVGMACFVLILAYVRFELSYDRFHDKSDRIFRIISREASPRADVVEFFSGTPDVLAPALTADIPEINRTTRICTFFGEEVVLQNEEKCFVESGLFADGQFLEVFSFPLLRGDEKSALIAPGSIVITRNVARELFGEADPIGKPILFKGSYLRYDLVVTGVLKDVPANSHLQFEFLISVETMRVDKSNGYMFNTWDVANFVTYAELADPKAKTAVEQKFPAFIKKYAKDETGVQLVLQPLKDIHLRSQIRGELATNNEIRTVRLFSAIALVLLLIAGFNYVNLTTARSAARSKEIGVRKVTGAGRRQLFEQFLEESLVTAFAALAPALALIRLFWPRFKSLIGISLDFRYLLGPGLLALIFGTALLVGIFSGIYPALVLSGFPPVRALRDFARAGRKGSFLRSILVVLQFSASIILIIGTTIIWRQMNFIRSKNLGYDREHVVVIPVREKETEKAAEAIRSEYLEYPEVLGVSLTSGLPTNIRSRYLNTRFQRDNGENVAMDICFDYVDENFLDVFKIELARGRNFSKGFGGDKSAVLLNESAVRAVGWKDPIGKKVPFGPQVVGVVKDFYFASFHTKIEPLALQFSPGGAGNIAVRIRPGNLPRTLARLKAGFESKTRSQPFDYFFLDDAFNRLYQKEMRAGEIFRIFAFLTIIIACLGLSGLTAFAVERRTKEIGIRKVLGASVPRLMTLLTKEFAALVLIANLLAWPVAYFAMNKWLQNFAYKINLSLVIFLGAAAGALLIALVTISFQTSRAALANPVDTLRYE